MQPFSVFLPVFNEEALIVLNTEKLITFLNTLQTSYEIILGSNGSTDQTISLGQSLEHQYPNVRFFHLPQKGPGLAFAKALELMTTDRLVTLDMDLSVALRFIPEAVQLLDDYEIVIGSKRLGVENRSLYRRLGSDSFIRYSKWLGLPFDDYSLGAKAYQRSTLKTYPQAMGRGTFYVQRIIYLALQDKRPIKQIPVECTDNRNSRFNLWREGLYKFWCVSVLAFKNRG